MGKGKSSTQGGCYSILGKKYNILGSDFFERFPPRLQEAGISFIRFLPIISLKPLTKNKLQLLRIKES
jgi:hypothetical protein